MKNETPSFNGRIEVICGPMFSGKTEELIRRLKRLKYSRTEFLLFKPKVDTRYDEYNIVTHDNQSLISMPVQDAAEILEIWNANKDIRVIAIDEAQFFLIKEAEGKPNLVRVVQEMKKHGCRLILNGLDMDFLGNPFGLMPELMAISDNITKLTSVCVICGKEAHMTYKMKPSLDQVELGSTDKYQSRCFEHWLAGANDKD